MRVPEEMQGVSARAVLHGDTVDGWQESMYYRYWNHGGHNVTSHYGIRTRTHKLVYYYGKPGNPEKEQTEPFIDPYWELYDLRRDPREVNNVHGEPAYAILEAELVRDLERLQARYGDTPEH